jgi:hypothetical protein
VKKEVERESGGLKEKKEVEVKRRTRTFINYEGKRVVLQFNEMIKERGDV